MALWCYDRLVWHTGHWPVGMALRSILNSDSKSSSSEAVPKLTSIIRTASSTSDKQVLSDIGVLLEQDHCGTVARWRWWWGVWGEFGAEREGDDGVGWNREIGGFWSGESERRPNGMRLRSAFTVTLVPTHIPLLMPPVQ